MGLYYSLGKTPLPRILFKGEDSTVRELIAQAQKANIPVIRFIWLTRTLYRTSPEGHYIPRETPQAVAQVYRVLRQLEDEQKCDITEME